MKREYPEFLLEEFGNDLQDIFGTVEEQENKISLRSIAGSPKKVKELCDKLPNNGVLDVYEIFGKYHRPTYLEVAVHVLKMLHALGNLELFAYETHLLPILYFLVLEHHLVQDYSNMKIPIILILLNIHAYYLRKYLDFLNYLKFHIL